MQWDAAQLEREEGLPELHSTAASRGIELGEGSQSQGDHDCEAPRGAGQAWGAGAQRTRRPARDTDLLEVAGGNGRTQCQ